MTKKANYGLVCLGGGAHGAYQVGALKYIHEKFCHENKSPFQLFSGSSCGAINTSFFASQSYNALAGRLWLEELWRGFHVPEYHSNIVKNIAGIFYRRLRRSKSLHKATESLLDPAPMVDIIKKGFLRENLLHAFELGTTKGLSVAGTELLTGRSCWFQEGEKASTWNHLHSIGLTSQIDYRHVAASCSIPVYMPPVNIDGRYYLDGQLSLSKPLFTTINMGATHILNISTELPTPRPLATYQKGFKPKMSHVISMLINGLSNDKAQDDVVMLHNVGTIPKEFGDVYQTLHHPVKVYVLCPSKRISETGGIEGNGGLDLKKHHESHFMFHRKFIGKLIDFGYEDARDQHDQLKKFFADGKKSNSFFSMFKGKA